MNFAHPSEFEPNDGYSLLPFQFGRLASHPDQVLITALDGQWQLIPSTKLREVVDGSLPLGDLYFDLEARGIIHSNGSVSSTAPVLARLRTRKSFLFEGPSLHIFVVSLRCHHSCGYCQVSRQPVANDSFDLSRANALLAVDRLFESPSNSLTVEFQGGEPLLAFERIQEITEEIVRRNANGAKRIRFVVATTLHNLSSERLAFFRKHDFHLSTSLDGPAWLHNANRPTPGRDSYERTIEGIEAAREALGESRVAALTTITAQSLEHPIEIVDEYVSRRFHSIFLRPLSPYGFAARGALRLGYGPERFSAFYRAAFERILHHNRNGYELDEAYASMTLGQMLYSYPNGYVDMRSPTGAGFGALVYDYDGSVYPSDEARMLAAMGDPVFRLGHVSQSIRELFTSSAMEKVIRGAVLEAIPGCHDCVFRPYCGADPIDSYARQGDEIGHRPSSPFCKRQMSFFEFMFEAWLGSDAVDQRILRGWAREGLRTRSGELEHAPA